MPKITKGKIAKTKLLSGEKGGTIRRADGGKLIPLCLHKGRQKDVMYFPFWRERGNDDNSLSSLAVSP